MYPIIVRRLPTCAPRDRIVAAATAGPSACFTRWADLEPRSPVEGLHVENPNPDSSAEWVLYPRQMDTHRKWR